MPDLSIIQEAEEESENREEFEDANDGVLMVSARRQGLSRQTNNNVLEVDASSPEGNDQGIGQNEASQPVTSTPDQLDETNSRNNPSSSASRNLFSSSAMHNRSSNSATHNRPSTSVAHNRPSTSTTHNRTVISATRNRLV